MRTRSPANPGSRLGMPLAAWPASDRAAWDAAFRPAARFSFSASGGAKLRPPSKDAILGGYARWLVWLRGRAPEALAEPAVNRATEERVIDYLNDLDEEVTPRTLFNYGCRLKQALVLMCPRTDWSWFDPLLGDLQLRARTAKPARRGFVPSGQLLDYGMQLMEEAERTADITQQVRAELFRNGLMIAFLAMRPLRLKNLTQLALGTELVESAAGFDVTILPDRTKTKNTLEFPAPAVLVPAMRRYLEHYRPALAAGLSGAGADGTGEAAPVWLARSGAQFPADTFTNMVAKRTLARFGQRLTPHEFRHCAATSIAEFNPEDFGIIRLILGHATTAMAEQYYIRAKGREAVRCYQAVIRGKRSEIIR